MLIYEKVSSDEVLNQMEQSVHKYLPEEFKHLQKEKIITSTTISINLISEKYQIIFSFDIRDNYLGGFIRSHYLVNNQDIGRLKHISTVIGKFGVTRDKIIPTELREPKPNLTDDIDRLIQLNCIELQHLHLWTATIN